MELNFDKYEILIGDCLKKLKELPDKCVQTCITSPPYYGLRDYGTAHWEGGDPNCPHYRTNKVGKNDATGHKKMAEMGQPVGDAIYKSVCPMCGAVRVDDQIGLEETPEDYVQKLVEVFEEVKRVLKDDGTLWLNLGDTYAGGAGRWGGTDNISEKQSSNQGSITQIKNTKKWEHAVIKPKDLIGIPWMVAFALRSAGWYLRQDIIWQKANPMPESVTDRCTKSHEYIFLLSKHPNYYFDYESIQEEATGYDGRKDTLLKGSPKYSGKEIMPGMNEQSLASGQHERWKFKKVQTDIKFGGNKYGDSNDTHFQTYSGNAWEQKVITDGEEVVPIRNKRDVWTVNVNGYKEAHFATYPEKLVEPCILAGSKLGDIVLDPFNGSGTTGVVAMKLGRKYIGCELNPEYVNLTKERFEKIFEQTDIYKSGDGTVEKFKKTDLF